MDVLLILIIISATFWFSAYYSANDFSVPSRSIDEFKKVLIVFPHPDDEALGTSGLITKLNKNGADVRYLIITSGEKGTPDASFDESLKEIRKAEAKNVSQILGIDKLILENIPDGEVVNNKEIVRELVKSNIESFNPELLITFDPAGLYGHPDHIATSEVVTDLVKNEFTEIKLWYVSYPKKILDQTNLPEHMARDRSFKDRRVYPTFKINSGAAGVINKSKVLYIYKSQREAFKETFPIKQLPLWFYTSLMNYEYFHEVNK